MSDFAADLVSFNAQQRLFHVLTILCLLRKKTNLMDTDGGYFRERKKKKKNPNEMRLFAVGWEVELIPVGSWSAEVLCLLAMSLHKNLSKPTIVGCLAGLL